MQKTKKIFFGIILLATPLSALYAQVLNPFDYIQPPIYPTELKSVYIESAQQVISGEYEVKQAQIESSKSLASSTPQELEAPVVVSLDQAGDERIALQIRIRDLLAKLVVLLQLKQSLSLQN